MNKSATISKLAQALAKAHAEMPVVQKNSTNPFLKNKYADLGAVIDTSRPILAKYELAVVQSPVNDGDKIGVTTLLIHSSGEFIEDTIYIPSTDAKGLSIAQSSGVVISYLRRYALQSFLNMYADEDVDGQKHEAPKSAQTDKRADTVKRYELLADKAVKLGLTNVMVLTAEMSIDDINAIGKTLKMRVEEKEKAGK